MRNLPGYSAGLFFIGSSLLVSFSPGCGSEVTSSGGSGSSGSGTSSSSSGGDPLSAVQACNDQCHKLETMNCTLGGDCMTQCDTYLQNVPPECLDEATTFFNCTLLNTTSCDPPAQCMTEQQTLSTCISTYGCAPDGTCFGSAGMNGEMSCGCDSVCKGTKYSTNCTTPAGGGMTTCDCLKNDVSIGMCMMGAPGGACGPKDTCCNAQYFNL
jgi:hypothetical protein